MGSRRGSTEFTAVRSLSWPLGLAAGVGAFFAIRTGMPWLLSHQSGPIAQRFSQGISTVLAPIAWLMLSMCGVAVLALFIGCYDARKLLDARTTLQSLVANGCRQFELLVGEVLRRQSCAVEETGLGTEGDIASIPPKDESRTLVQCKQSKRRQVGVSVVGEAVAGGLSIHLSGF